jgi:hypothetical protein
MKKIFYVGLLLLFVLIVGEAKAQQTVTPYANSGSTQQITCATSTTVIEAKNLRRVTAYIQNLDTTNFLWVCPATTCTATTGMKVTPSSASSITALGFNPNEYGGPLSCLADTASVVITYTKLIR